MKCPSIRAASTTAPARAAPQNPPVFFVSINQSRVNYCAVLVWNNTDTRTWVSINQSRVNYCAPAYPKLLKNRYLCTRFRARVPWVWVDVNESCSRTPTGAISTSKAANFGDASAPRTPSRHRRARRDEQERRNSQHVKETSRRLIQNQSTRA